MFTTTRKVKETLVIGHNVFITVEGVYRKEVEIKMIAPKEIKVSPFQKKDYLPERIGKVFPVFTHSMYRQIMEIRYLVLLLNKEILINNVCMLSPQNYRPNSIIFAVDAPKKLEVNRLMIYRKKFPNRPSMIPR